MPIDTMLETASRLLPRRLDEPVELIDAVELDSEETVVRVGLSPVREGEPVSVIVKKTTDTTFDQPGHEGPPQRFLNEWAGLDFLASLEHGRRVCPLLIAGDRGSGVIVMEDLGPWPTLQAKLLTQGPSPSFGQVGRLFGEMHVATHGREAEFRQVQARLGTSSPWSDSTVDQRRRGAFFGDCLDRLGVVVPKRLTDEIAAVESMIHDGTTFRSLIHADAGPQNILVSDEGMRLVDFEFCVFGNGLSDVVGARLGFPQTSEAMAVPVDDATTLEKAYRDAIVDVVPQAESNDVFDEALTAAAGHWALNRWAASWGRVVGPAIEHDRGLTSEERDALGRTILVFDGFVRLTSQTSHAAAVARAIDGYAGAVRRRWPEITPPGRFPALRSV